ncbi:MAG: DUF3426 domain-containing protein, partial [Caulobacteraceae bacterium]
MILTCPECASRYFVKESSLAGGRTVRCSSCGSSWRAEAPLDLVSTPDEGAYAAEPAGDLGAPPIEDIHKVFRARAEEKARVKEAAAAGAVWAGLGAGFALILISAMVFRTDVARIMPRAASAYAAIGLPVNTVGLTIEKVQASPALQDGRAALSVSGVLRNIRTRPVTPPLLTVSLIDKSGKTVLKTAASAGDAPIPAGASRPFVASVVEPPPGANDVEVAFDLSRKPPAKVIVAATSPRDVG